MTASRASTAIQASGNGTPGPKAERPLIVNADDFGYSRAINRGIIQTHEQGIVTSASLMVRWPFAGEAAEYARAHPRLGVGLHVDYGEWYYFQGHKVPRYLVVAEDSRPEVYADEFRRQLDAFRGLMGREPSHIDTHQHLHFPPGTVRSVLRKLCKELGLPLRGASRIAFCGAYYGQGIKGRSFPERISAQSLCSILASLPEGGAEIGCHPATGVDFDSTYADERMIECAVLCDPSVLQCVQQNRFRLSSFHDAGI